MRTEAKHVTLSRFALLIVLIGMGSLACSQAVYAAAATVPTSETDDVAAALVDSAPPDAPPSLPANAATTPAQAAAPVISNVTAEVPPSLSPPPPAGAKAEKPGKGLEHAENKIADTARDAIKQLSSSDTVTLDDLNTARQAIAKIDALIEIEKRLAELEKVRGGDRGRSLASSIPASALAPPVPSLPVPALPVPSQSSQVFNQIPTMPSLSPVEISRITGNAGRYTAYVKGVDGQFKPVKVGDAVPGAGKVLAITPNGISLSQNDIKRFVRIKNVDTVFSQNH
ncbi:MAG: hypothetical protein WAO98_10545 [Alphaproteobacteria bacterium]